MNETDIVCSSEICKKRANYEVEYKEVKGKYYYFYHIHYTCKEHIDDAETALKEEYNKGAISVREMRENE